MGYFDSLTEKRFRFISFVFRFILGIYTMACFDQSIVNILWSKETLLVSLIVRMLDDVL